MCNVIGKRLYDKVPDVLLHKKIGFALYGVPTEMKNDNSELTYTKDKNEKIEKLRQHILSSRKSSDSRDTCIAFLYIHLRSKDKNNEEAVSVLFRILQGPPTDANLDNYYFVDSNCRNYKDWKDFLEENTLPKCDMCVPSNGVYSEFKGRVEVNYVESPACRLSNKLLNCLDNTSTVLGVAATGVSVACVVAPAAAFAAPVVALGAGATIIISGAYDAGRNIFKLVDCGKHDESLSLKNSKSRSLWLGLATSSLGAVATGGKFIGKARSLFKAGEAIFEAESAVLRFINFSSLAVSGVTVINSLVNAVIKFKEGTLERIDILQFIDACYFFINALITTEVAHWLIGTVASGDPVGMYFRNREFSIIDTLIDTRNNRNYRLLMKLIGKNKFMPKIDVEEIDRITATLTRHVRDLSSGRITWAEFMFEMAAVSTTVWHKFKDPVISAVNKLLEINDDAPDSQSIFVDPVHREIVYKKPDIARQLCLVVQNVIEQSHVDDNDGSIMKAIFALIFTFTANYQSNFTVEFLEKARFVCECVSIKFNNLTDEYELARDIAEATCDPATFDDNQFNRGWGFADQTDIPRSLLQRSTYHLLASIDEMKEYYGKISCNSERPTCEPPCLETDVGNCYIFDCESASTDQEYWNLLVSITGLNLNDRNATMFRLNDVVLIRPNDQNSETKLASFITVEEDDSAVGILTVIKKERNLNQ